MEQKIVVAEAEDAGIRADVFLSEELDKSRSAVQKMMDGGFVLLACKDGTEKRVSKHDRIQANDSYLCWLPDPEPCQVEPEDLPLDVRYEDDDVIVINKAKGMVVHPAPGHENGTLVSALLFRCKDSLSGIGGELRPGIVHRIDKDTTGLIAVAKNDFAHAALAAQLADHTMHRVYQAIVIGCPKDDEGTIHAAIGRSSADRKKMAVVPQAKGRDAITHYTVLERFQGFSLIECRLETGRTHQIRVHMSSIGHPLLGDTVYGGGKTLFEKKHASYIEGQALHAKQLVFNHPRTGEIITVEAPLPENFETLLRLLRNG